MSLIDTNILIYATVPGFPEHLNAHRLLTEILDGTEPHYITWVNLFEYLRAVTHRKLVRPAPMPMERALENVCRLIEHPSIARIDAGPRHLEHFRTICREAAPVEDNFVHDCRIAAIMRENGIRRILTRDNSFRRIPGITVVDPLR